MSMDRNDVEEGGAMVTLGVGGILAVLVIVAARLT